MNDRVFAAQMIAYIEAHLLENVSGEELALRSGYSGNRLRQKFFNVTGDTPAGYIRKRRLTEAAKEILGGASIADTAQKYCYSSQENFTTAFRSYFGITPKDLSQVESQYRRFIARMREVYTIMEVAGLRQPPLSTTLMGCVKGISDYFDYSYSAAELFGLSGHAFVINIHGDLCPSGPYVWNKRLAFDRLLSPIGIRFGRNLNVTRETSGAERQQIEHQVRESFDAGNLWMLDFLEHQLASGYDEEGFILLQPWQGRADSEVPRITFGTWSECLAKEGWASMTEVSHEPTEVDYRSACKRAVTVGHELLATPQEYENDAYTMGLSAYEVWKAAIAKGLGRTHGHWWNATVWSECRAMGSEFFGGLGERGFGDEVAGECSALESLFATASSSLAAAGDREADETTQREALDAAESADRKSVQHLAALAEAL